MVHDIVRGIVNLLDYRLDADHVELLRDRIDATTADEFYARNGSDSLKYLFRMPEPKWDWVEPLLANEADVTSEYVRFALKKDREDIAVQLMCAMVKDGPVRRIGAKLVESIDMGSYAVTSAIMDAIMDHPMIEKKSDDFDEELREATAKVIKRDDVRMLNRIIDVWSDFGDPGIIDETLHDEMDFAITRAIEKKNVDMVSAMFQHMEDVEDDLWHQWWATAAESGWKKLRIVLKEYKP